MSAREHPMPGQVLMVVDSFGRYDEIPDGEGVRTVTDDLDEANVVTSCVAGSDGQHKPVLDLDLGASLVPSTTSGHWHLYLDVAMPWATYRRLLEAMGDAGILEPGYVSASVAREHTAVRLPWVSKGAPGQAQPITDPTAATTGPRADEEASS